MKLCAALFLFFGLACIPAIHVDERPCPCASDYQCCDGVCISEAESCGVQVYDAGRQDALVLDVEGVDLEQADVEHNDSAGRDAGAPDLESIDGSAPDTNTPDGSPLDSALDAGTPDQGRVDAAVDDRAYPDGAVGDVDPMQSATRIQAPELNAEAGFGVSFALAGDTLVVGAPGQGDGVVYVYVDQGAGFVETAVLRHQTGDSGEFGRSVAVGSGFIVVGAPGMMFDLFDGAGRAYVYFRVNGVWTRIGVLQGEQAENAFFGETVALGGFFPSVSIYVGATGEDVSGFGGAGAVYEFLQLDSSGELWQRRGQRVSTHPATRARFGSALVVDVAATTLVVSADEEDPTPGTGSSGVVYIFERELSSTSYGSWQSPQRLMRDPAEGNWGDFGAALALDGDRLLIGAPEYAPDQSHLTSRGAAFLYTRDEATGVYEQSALLLGDDTPNDDSLTRFGRSVALRGNVALIGATTRWPNEIIDSKGAAYLFENPADAGWTQTLRVPTESLGADARFGHTVALGASGSPVIIGAPGASFAGQSQAGAVYVYRP